MGNGTEEDYNFVFKVVLIGESGVGKTNLLSRFTRNEFSHDSRTTIGVEFSTRTVMLGTAAVKAQIWDTAGLERYRAITSASGHSGAGRGHTSCYHRAHDDDRGLQHGHVEPSFAIAHTTTAHRSVNGVFPFLAENNGLLFLETSALDSTNVELAFETVLKEIFAKVSKQRQNSIRTNAITLGSAQAGQEPGPGEKRACCISL
ncbi:PREDICTED: ras-related protein Rab-25 [Cercocebus atys]|uniref:ras-related protein Rab-25 n=1 Tax=Cercocebus atys TaxID=9531 RepID=UPI0005F471FC|nr:PREDICTED: ras-related protein Rab-25 [Cercocebus atys]